MQELTKHVVVKHGSKVLLAVAGTFFYAFGINMFITGMGLYSGGVMGICQLIRSLVDYIVPQMSKFDISGIIYYIINIPIFIMAYKTIGKMFLARTIICVTTISVFMSVIPIPSTMLVEDELVMCLIGGLISGFGSGLTLRMGSSSGGMDIISIYCIKHSVPLSVGNISLIINIVLYGICMVAFNVDTAIYSIIFAVASAMALDATYSQSINVEVTVITKSPQGQIEKAVNEGLTRGVTSWHGQGAYTGEGVRVLYIVMSKYEVPTAKHIIKSIDPSAFVVVKEAVKVDGNFLKKLV